MVADDNDGMTFDNGWMTFDNGWTTFWLGDASQRCTHQEYSDQSNGHLRSFVTKVVHFPGIGSRGP
jgi:hypothetical protein